MRIVFMGTPQFAVPSLLALHDAGFEPVTVVTAPDKPRGRGQQMSGTAVKDAATRLGIPVLQPDSMRDERFADELRALAPDLFVVVAFRILPESVFNIPTYGSFNLHASLLPKYRGAAPINWALIRGEKESGVTTFFLKPAVDTGNIILQERTELHDDMTAGELHDCLMTLGADVVLRTVRRIETGNLITQLQDDAQATPAPKIFKDTCRLDWTRPARDVHNLIRGLSPYPAAWTHHRGKLIKILRSQVLEEESSGESGALRIDANGLQVQCGRGSLAILELQQEGKRAMGVEEFLRGYRFTAEREVLES
ncbi:MAG: methionyl-tRNA formyltransferase [Bacteroidia bacterium]|nr:methionyl-tRNA formyltransferase [Bacteroidia bacterium]